MKLLKIYKVEIAVVLSTCLLSFLLSSFFGILLIQGDSMSPTYENNNVLFVKKTNEIKKGNLIVFTPPKSWSSNEHFIKRVTAKNGDVVTIKNNSLFVNNKKIQSRKCEGINFTTVLKENELFVVGDNPNNSHDSLYRICKNQQNYTISKDDIFLIGTELFVLGGIK